MLCVKHIVYPVHIFYHIVVTSSQVLVGNCCNTLFLHTTSLPFVYLVELIQWIDTLSVSGNMRLYVFLLDLTKGLGNTVSWRPWPETPYDGVSGLYLHVKTDIEWKRVRSTPDTRNLFTWSPNYRISTIDVCKRTGTCRVTSVPIWTSNVQFSYFLSLNPIVVFPVPEYPMVNKYV